MHGTNGFKEDIMKECIKHGVSKVNVNKLTLDKYNAYVKENASSQPITKLMEVGVEKVIELTEWQMDVCGSTGKAR